MVWTAEDNGERKEEEEKAGRQAGRQGGFAGERLLAGRVPDYIRANSTEMHLPRCA